MNYLVETKNEYTIQLTNILVPLIYEGISSIYDDAIKIANQEEELKTFQIFLKKIPKWNNNLLENETNRILCMSTCPELLKKLVDAVVKANIMILTNTHPSDKSLLKINTNFDFKEFIHNCYIESARSFYTNPFLFYHKHSLYDINRNQKDAKEIIRNAIIEAIRKMLPLNMIIKEYLGNSFKDDSNVNIDVTISEAKKQNLKNLMKLENKKNDDFVKKNYKSQSLQEQEGQEPELEQQFINKIDQKLEKSESESEKEPEKEPESVQKQVQERKVEKNNIERKTDKELSYNIQQKLEKSDKKMTNKSEKNHIEEDDHESVCASVSYYKHDGKNKVLDSFSNNTNINTNIQEIFLNHFSVELSDEKKLLMSEKDKSNNTNNNKTKKSFNYQFNL
jgi:hypothetical protein